jgi:16S rRNA (uracil1498-N3)-methyltransferase
LKPRHLVVATKTLETNPIVLSQTDVHHLSRVLRLREGHELTVTDGLGQLCKGTISAVSKSRVEVTITQRQWLPEPPAPRLKVFPALARGARAEWALQKCVELSADEVQPVICERSVMRPRDAERKLERWYEIVRQAARQSERLRLPTLYPPVPFHELLSRTPRAPGLRLLATPHTDQPLTSFEKQLRSQPPAVEIAIGPEGGFTPGEITAASEAAFQPVALGSAVLRAETAVVVLLGLVAYLTGRLSASPPTPGDSPPQ